MNSSHGPLGHTRRVNLRRWGGAAAVVGVLVSLVAGPLGAASADAPAESPTISDAFPNSGNPGYDVTHYDIDMTYRSNDSISATTTITAAATGDLSTLSFDFEGLSVEAVTVDGAPALWSRQRDPGAGLFKLVVTPAAPVSGQFDVAVTYSGAPEAHQDPDGTWEGWIRTADGSTALGQPLGSQTWFPNNNTPSDKASYSLSVTAPTSNSSGPVSVATSGNLDGAVADIPAGTTTWNWNLETPTAPELIVLSVGNFDVIRSTITLASGRTLPEWSFVDSNLPQWVKDQVDGQRARITHAIDWLETKLGTYPGDSVGVIVDPDTVGYALETQDRPFFSGAINSDHLVHELVHQWLGNNVSPETWSHIWLNEGGAEFFTAYYNIDNDPNAGPIEDVFFGAWRDTQPDRGEWNLPSAGWTNPSDLYGFSVYVRSKYALNALMVAVGQVDFDRLFLEWATRFGGSSATTADFANLAEEVSGRDLDAFFLDWIYEGQKPAWPSEYEVGLKSTANGLTLDAGDRATLELAVENVGQVPLDSAEVRLESPSLLAEVSLAGPLAEGLAIVGTTPVWTVPALQPGETATLTIPFVVKSTSSEAAIQIVAASVGLGSRVDSAAVSFATSKIVATPTPTPTPGPDSPTPSATPTTPAGDRSLPSADSLAATGVGGSFDPFILATGALVALAVGLSFLRLRRVRRSTAATVSPTPPNI